MNFKKTFALILALLLSFVVGLPSFAAIKTDELVSPCYIQIMLCRADLTASGQNVTASASVRTYENTTVKVRLKIEQSLTGMDGSWEPYATYPLTSVSAPAQELKTVQRTKTVESGYCYRTVAEIYVYINNVLIEDTVAYSTYKRVL